MIHELIDPKKKTNKTIAARNTKTLQDNKPFSDHCTFEPSDSENKEVESSSTTFIPPWLRNSLGLNQRNNQSQAAAGHSEPKPAKVIHRYKEPIQNEFESAKPKPEEDCCKKVTSQFDTSPPRPPEEENTPRSTDGALTNDVRAPPVRWQIRRKESDTDSSCPVAETKSFEKAEAKMTNGDVMTEVGKLREEEKKKQLKFVRQKAKVRRRGTSDQKGFETGRSEADGLMEMKAREALGSYLKKNEHEVSSEMTQLETKLTILGAKRPNASSVKLNPEELRLLQDMKEQMGSTGDFDVVLERVKEVNMRDIIKNSDFLANSIGDKRAEYKEERSGREMTPRYDDGKSNVDKDSLLSTDDENDIKRFSEFLSKNKNAEEKRKCLEEVRNYFERKRRTRMSKRRYLDEIKAKLVPEVERREEVLREKAKCRDLFTLAPNRGKRSKFALCDEEVVEKAVDETLQKFVELYHFHVSPAVMGNMKKNILQAMQSDSLDSSCSKVNLEPQAKVVGRRARLSDTMHSPVRSQKGDLRPFDSQVESAEVPNKEAPSHRDMRKKNFKTLLVSSTETLGKAFKETDVVENERLKRLKKEFENFLHSVQNHIDVSNMKIQSIVLEREEQMGPSRHVQFVNNFSRKGLEGDKQWQRLKETQEPKMFKDISVQAALKKDLLKKSVRVQAVEFPHTLDQGLQTEEKTRGTQATQTEGENVTLREIKELKSFNINPGLYRMVKSKEAGKFYLYPEQLDDEKTQVFERSNSSVLKDRRSYKKRELLNVLSNERSKERRVYFKDKEKGRLKKCRKTYYTVAHLKGGLVKREKNFENQNSESLQSKREEMCKYESADGGERGVLEERAVFGERAVVGERVASGERAALGERAASGERAGLGDTKHREHLGCVWFWNGEKINPGFDLKTHVEDLLKEKLKEITELDPLQNRALVNDLNLMKMGPEALSGCKDLHKGFESKSVLCFRNFHDSQKIGPEHLLFGIDKESTEATVKAEEKIAEEGEDVKAAALLTSQEKLVRNVGTQNSGQKILSFNLAKTRTQSKTAIEVGKKKQGKRGAVIRPVQRKLLNFRKAEGIIRAVEEIKRLRMELEGTRKKDSEDSESLLGESSTSSRSKNESDNPLSVVLGLKDASGGQEVPALSMNRLKKFIGLVDHQVQTGDAGDVEDANSDGSRAAAPAMENHKHLELIENVLCRVNQKERETLWNDVREFIKTKIGRDIDDDGAREVCIEIEQDMPKNEHGTAKQAVLARGHYVRNEGDVEVEIDLTLDDLEKILRQRQRKIRKQHLYRKRYKRFISSSSIQSDLTKDDVRKYQKYLSKFAALGGDFTTEKPSGSLRKTKGN